MSVAGRASTVALAWLLAACGTGPSGTLVLGCPLDQISGVLEPLGPPGSLGIAVGNEHLVLAWGDGTRTVDIDGTLSVVSPAGAVTARVGDTVNLTGGRIRAGEFVACGPGPAS